MWVLQSQFRVNAILVDDKAKWDYLHRLALLNTQPHASWTGSVISSPEISPTLHREHTILNYHLITNTGSMQENSLQLQLMFNMYSAISKINIQLLFLKQHTPLEPRLQGFLTAQRWVQQVNFLVYRHSTPHKQCKRGRAFLDPLAKSGTDDGIHCCMEQDLLLWWHSKTIKRNVSTRWSICQLCYVLRQHTHTQCETYREHTEYCFLGVSPSGRQVPTLL